MKLVLIINSNLPLGIIADTAAVLGLSVGDKVSGLTGSDIPDQDGHVHTGITKINIPVLGATGGQLKNLYNIVLKAEDEDIRIIDFNIIAQRCKSYDDYSRQLAACGEDGLDFLGLCFYGPERKINKLTGSLGLLK